MAIKKTIAIIGATGNEGSAIARTLVKEDYRLLLISTAEKELEQLVSDLTSSLPLADVEGMQCEFDASWEADIVILAVPCDAEQEIADRIRQVTTGKTVISITAPADCTSKESLQQLLPHSKVMKVYHSGNLKELSAALISFLN